MTLITLVISGLGVLAIITEHYYGRTSKSGGAEVVLDGSPAMLMGAVLVFLGMFPLAAWFHTKQQALAWMLACIALSGAVLGALLIGH